MVRWGFDGGGWQGRGGGKRADCSHAGHKHLRPKSIHDPEVLEAFSDEYMYFACIRFINSVRPRGGEGEGQVRSR